MENNVKQPLIDNATTSYSRNQKQKDSGHGHPWMVYFCTIVAAGYSSPTQSAITAELGLSTAE
ncbi:Sugar transporter ERD6-like 7, partial [Bienertia sinuspersici]